MHDIFFKVSVAPSMLNFGQLNISFHIFDMVAFGRLLSILKKKSTHSGVVSHISAGGHLR